MLQIPALLVFSILTLSFVSARADVRVEEVEPGRTEESIRTITGSHQVVFDPAVQSNGKLLITIGGTNSKPTDLAYVQTLAASLGFHSLGIDYPNSVATSICQTRPERDCFDNYREEIVIGRSVSPYVQVNISNSVLNRINALFAHLMKFDYENWRQFANSDGSLDWTKTVLVGHSQGAGHVAYLSKHFEVGGVVMTGGPFDKSGSGLAGWLSIRGSTPLSRLTAFLHQQDFFGSNLQINVIRALLHDANAEVAQIDNAIAPGSSAQIFLTNRAAADPHNSFATPEFENVWKTLLKKF